MAIVENIKKEVFTYNKKTYEVMFYPNEHKYFVNGVKTKGTTSITGLLDKPNLIYWASAEAVKNLYYKWKQNGNLEETDFDVAYGCHKKKSDVALDIGSAVHKVAENFCKWKKGEMSQEQFENTVNRLEESFGNQDDKERFKSGLDAFATWYKENVKQLLNSEFLVYNPELEYATQIDIMYENKDGDFKIANYKTSSGVYDEHHIQATLELMAYEKTFFDGVGGVEIICFYKEDIFNKDPKRRFLKENEVNPNAVPIKKAGDVEVVSVKTSKWEGVAEKLALLGIELEKSKSNKKEEE